jgi:hypothetical protein
MGMLSACSMTKNDDTSRRAANFKKARKAVSLKFRLRTALWRCWRWQKSGTRWRKNSTEKDRVFRSTKRAGYGPFCWGKTS